MRKRLVLSIDGGGTKGLFSNFVLRHMEKDMCKRAYEIFDVIIGVSSGAIVSAIGATDCNRNDSDIIDDVRRIFTCNRSKDLYNTLYDSAKKTEVLTKHMGETRMCDTKTTLLIPVISTNGVITSFESTNDDHKHLRLSKLLDASTAVPILFQPVGIGSTNYMDIGLIMNDPVLLALQHVKKRWPDDEVCIVSIGTSSNMGRESKNMCCTEMTRFGLIHWLMCGIVDIIMSSHEHHIGIGLPLTIKPGNYMRIDSGVSGMMNDTTDEMLSSLRENADFVWENNRSVVLQWMKAHVSES